MGDETTVGEEVNDVKKDGTEKTPEDTVKEAFSTYLKETHDLSAKRDAESVARKKEVEKQFVEALQAYKGDKDALIGELRDMYEASGDQKLTNWFIARLNKAFGTEETQENVQVKEKTPEEIAAEEDAKKKEAERIAQEAEEVKKKEAEEKAAAEATKTMELSQESDADRKEDIKGVDGAKTDWEKAFVAAKKYADEYAETNKNRYPIPTKITGYGATGADLESGAKICVNPENPNAVVLRTTKEGTQLEDCMTLMKAGKEKGFTSVNITNGTEEFKKAMYQAAKLNGLTVKGLENFDEKTLAAWDAEIDKMKEGKIPESHKKAKEAEKTEKADKKAEHAATVFGEEDKKKIDKFLRTLDDMAIAHIDGGKKGFSLIDKGKIKAAWKETGIKGVTVADILAARSDTLKKHEDSMESKAPGMDKAREALLETIAPREINEVVKGVRQAAQTFSPNDSQKKEITELLKDMEKAFGKQYGQPSLKESKEKYTANVERFAAKIKKMAAHYDVTPKALTDSIKTSSGTYDQILSHDEKADKTELSKGKYLEIAFDAAFNKAPTAQVGALANAKIELGRKIEDVQIDRVFNKAQKQEKKAQKKQVKEAKKSVGTVLKRLKGTQTR